ncbi:type II secretion system protein [Succinimonas amylolytica]|uniref:type II secretion system protein n=1 Tax=Succinimonas amylolytica TaxID=83769 RepID=UPI0023A888C5
MYRSKGEPPGAGFTLIELVVVIVILGILAAVATPKFMGLQSDARAASLKGVEVALKSADKMFYAKAVLQGMDKTCDIAQKVKIGYMGVMGMLSLLICLV